MMMKDHIVETFMGSSFESNDVQTIGQLKEFFKDVLKELPEDDDLQISELTFQDGKIDYTLTDGITE